MANPEHMKILKQGVVTWNQWRKENPDVIPDLSETDLSWADLKNANLQIAKLSESNLFRVDLSFTDLTAANLSWTNLAETELYETRLTSANLYGADLSGARFTGAMLSGAKFKKAKLIKANLVGAVLSDIDFFNADLTEANLARANLTRANLHLTNLKEANLNRANLLRATLIGANLTGANIEDADMTATTLLSADLSNAKLRGAKLWGAARNGWKIEGVQCAHIYDDPDGKNKVPKARNFVDGEFEKLYTSLPTFEQILENNIPTDFEEKTNNDEWLKKLREIEEESEQKDKQIGQLTEANLNLSRNLGGITVNDNRQTHIGGDVSNSSLGDNSWNQTWNLAQIDNSTKLDGETKAWLKSIAGELEKANLDKEEQSIAQSQIGKLQNELEKEQKDESKIKKLWNTLVALAPDVQKISTLPDSINKILNLILGSG